MAKSFESAEALLKSEMGDVRTLGRLEQWIVASVAVGWSLFQLALPSVLILDVITKRAVHLAFAMVLLFLLMPCFTKKRTGFRFLWTADHIPAVDYILAASGAASALHLVVNYGQIALRAGIPTTQDLFFGILLVVLLLEATRRIVGPALPVIALLFTIYAFLGPYMPQMLAFRGVSLSRYISSVTLSTEGIYGIPLGVSASIVFLFVLFGALLDRKSRHRAS
ncbi:MAG: hypothetical protein R6U50_08855 [Desulfobacterales bacterium]